MQTFLAVVVAIAGSIAVGLFCQQTFDIAQPAQVASVTPRQLAPTTAPGPQPCTVWRCD